MHSFKNQNPLSEFTRQLVQRDPRILERFRLCYQSLASLPRGVRRRLQHSLRRKLAMTTAAAALLIAVSGMPVYAATITVDTGARGINPGDGCSLVEAIVNANDDAATYAECVAGSGDDTITLPTNEAMTYTTAYGAGSALPVITDGLTITGNGSTIGRDGAASQFRIIEVQAVSFELSDATVTGGDAGADDGGGIYAPMASVNLDHATITGNHAYYGGGVAIGNGTLTADYSDFTYNTADAVGGGIYANETDVTLTHALVDHNYAIGTAGAGMAWTTSESAQFLTIRNSTITNNDATGSGGGLAVYGGILDTVGTVLVADSTISGNSAFSGGGIALYGSLATVQNSTLSDNTAGAGGGIATFVSNAVVSGTQVTGNTAYYGGGIFTATLPVVPYASQVVVTNSTISGNHAVESEHSGDEEFYLGIGGGMFNAFGGAIMLQSTVSGNDAEEYGGGIYSGTYLISNGRGGVDGAPGEMGKRIENRREKQGAGHTPGLKRILTHGKFTKFAEQLDKVNVNLKEAGARLKEAGARMQAQAKQAAPEDLGDLPLPPYATALVNSTVSGNTADVGGGISSYLPMLTLNVTVAMNTATTAVGGIAAYGPFYLAQSLVSGNSAPEINELTGCECYSVYTSGYNLVGHDGETNAQAYAYFTPDVADITATSDGTLPTALASILQTTLGNNGGPTQTHALVADSPAIDKIPDEQCMLEPIYNIDQRHFARGVDGDGNPSSNECDIGAYEYASATGTHLAGLKGRVGPAGRVAVKWRTTSESQIAGFNVWRKTAAKDKGNKDAFRKLNGALLEAKHPGDASGSAYRFKDKDVRAGRAYRYKIEIVYLDGHSQWSEVMVMRVQRNK